MPNAPIFAAKQHAPQAIGPFAALLGWVLGTALPLQQAALSPVWLYGALALTGTLLTGLVGGWLVVFGWDFWDSL